MGLALIECARQWISYRFASKKYCKTDLNCFLKRHGAFADIATEYGKTSITDKNTLLSYYKNEVFPAVEQEGKVYFPYLARLCNDGF